MYLRYRGLQRELDAYLDIYTTTAPTPVASRKDDVPPTSSPVPQDGAPMSRLVGTTPSVQPPPRCFLGRIRSHSRERHSGRNRMYVPAKAT